MRACISAATATALVLLGACVVEDAYGPEGEIEQQEAWNQPLTGDGLTATLTYGSDWGTGYCADVKIQNTGTTATATWQVATNMNGSSVANAWNAATRMSGSQLIATPADHNASLAPGASTSFG